MKQIITPLGSIALYPETTIDISKNNPLLTRAEEFSIDLSIPREPNEHIFGHKYRLASAGTVDIIEAQFLFSGREKLSGSIELVSASDESYSILLKGSRCDFISRFGKTRLPDIEFGDEYFVPGVMFPTEAELITEMKNTLTFNRDWICFPMYWERTWGEWINQWSFDTNTFIWGGAGGWKTVFVRLHRAIERLFALKGYQVTENWFSDTAEKRNIAIFNNARDLSYTINIKRYLPDWSVSDFISELEDFFPVTFFINTRSKTVRISADNTMATDNPVDSLDRFLVNKPTVIFNDTKNGYDLKFTSPDDDKSTDQLYDYVDQAYSDEVNTFSDLPASTSLSGVIYLVLSEGRYYESTFDIVLEWNPVGNVALGSRSGKGELKRETKIYPLMNAIKVQHEEVAITQQYFDPMRVFVDFTVQVPFTSKPINKWAQDLRLMVYRGMDNTTHDYTNIPAGYEVTYINFPMANFVNRKQNGDRWLGQTLELRWDGEQGLSGPDAIAFIDGAEKVNVKLLMHHMELEKLDTSKNYTLHGRKVLISELTIHYTEHSSVEIDAVLLAQGR